MKIRYKFITGETIEIEVEENWANIILELDRQEYNNNHKEKRRHYSLDACTYEGADFAVEDSNLAALFPSDEVEKAQKAFKKLLPRQKELLIQVYIYGEKYVDIARREELDPSSVRQATQRAVKAFQRNFK